ncbi:MAG: ABC-type multidrug transport system, ATPase component [halophilic archaeon J07HX5]|nr:MAG: ABC-type multidrug transport system, ATPase component [halophilic archaeon J07HX5]
MDIVRTEKLTKHYGDVVAVEDPELHVKQGEVYGFLGPNGAGKITTINLLLGLVQSTREDVQVFGKDLSINSRLIRSQIGVLPAHAKPYDRLTARKHVEFVSRGKNADVEPDALLERVGIPDAADRPAGEFSTGMGQRLKLAMALVGEPELLILDEPTNGLDPNGARQMREIIQAENDRGATVFFSSHIMGQVEAVCDRVGVLNEGRLVAEDTVEEIRTVASGGAELLVTVDSGADRVAKRIQTANSVSAVTIDQQTQTVAITLNGIDDKGRAMTAVAEAVVGTNTQIRDFELREETLEDAFADLTQTEVPA